MDLDQSPAQARADNSNSQPTIRDSSRTSRLCLNYFIFLPRRIILLLSVLTKRVCADYAPRFVDMGEILQIL